MTDKAQTPDDPAQSQRFIDMAREVEAAEDDARFKKVLGVITKASQTGAPASEESDQD